RAGRARAHPAHPRVSEQQQDAGRGHPRHHAEDAPQQDAAVEARERELARLAQAMHQKSPWAMHSETKGTMLSRIRALVAGFSWPTMTRTPWRAGAPS